LRSTVRAASTPVPGRAITRPPGHLRERRTRQTDAHAQQEGGGHETGGVGRQRNAVPAAPADVTSPPAISPPSAKHAPTDHADHRERPLARAVSDYVRDQRHQRAVRTAAAPRPGARRPRVRPAVRERPGRPRRPPPAAIARRSAPGAARSGRPAVRPSLGPPARPASRLTQPSQPRPPHGRPTTRVTYTSVSGRKRPRPKLSTPRAVSNATRFRITPSCLH